ncbi:MAG: hypothetical protein KBS95_04465 [Alistipes sp.]|nr:hypothetical protein [Candidatus Alistipes equi]
MHTVQYRWNIFVWTVTLGICSVVAIAMACVLFSFFNILDIQPLPVALLSVFLLAVIFICEGTAPQRLEISSSHLTILCRYRSVLIPVSQIRCVRAVRYIELFPHIMLLGNCGLFGFVGHFWSKREGCFRAYATELKFLYLIETSDEKFVVSCRETQLLEELELN